VSSADLVEGVDVLNGSSVAERLGESAIEAAKGEG
jgi:hypothetical protein